jgi:hypothetical protein
MTPQIRFSRMAWIATLTLCIVLYALLHLKVNAVHSEVVRAEREIVRLEQRNMLLETEVLTRSNQLKLAQWNRVDFGFRAPEASQYIEGERQLAQFSSPPGADAPAPIRLAGLATGEGAPPFPQLVSPITGVRMDAHYAEPGEAIEGGQLALTINEGRVRVPLALAEDIRQ